MPAVGYVVVAADVNVAVVVVADVAVAIVGDVDVGVLVGTIVV